MGPDDIEASELQDAVAAPVAPAAPAADCDAPPPPYEGIFGSMAGPKNDSTGVVDFTKRAAKGCFDKSFGVVFIVIMIIVMVLLGLALPIAEIVIGSMYVHDCPAQRYLPIYLIVSGVFIGLFSFCAGTSTASKQSGDDDGGPSISPCCYTTNGVFLLAWLIAGTVWVTRMVNCEGHWTPGCFSTDVNLTGVSFYCPKLVYKFTYWDIIGKWTLLGVIIFLGITGFCVFTFYYALPESDESE